MTQRRRKKTAAKKRPTTRRVRTKPTLPEQFKALEVEPMPPIGVRTVGVIRDVILHVQSRFLVFPRDGVIYGRHGAPVGVAYKDGYVRVNCGDPLHQYAHRIIWSAVHGEIGPGYQIDHLNGRKYDNRILNLDRATHLQNLQRARLFGLAKSGDKHHSSKLTASLVRAIRKTRGKKSCAEWGRELGLHPTTIRDARSGKTWAHLTKPRRRRKSAAKRSGEKK